MEYISKGVISYKWDNYSYITCKLRFFLFFQSESLSQYLLVWLTIERLMAFYLPFDVRWFATKRNGQIILCFLILLTLIIAAPAMYHFDLSDHPNIPGQVTCTGAYKGPLEIVIFIIFTCILCEILPEIIVLICTFLLGFKIYTRIHKSSRIAIPICVKFRKVYFNGDGALVPAPSPSRASTSELTTSKMSFSSKIQSTNDMKLAKSIYILASLEMLLTLFPLLPWIVYAIIKLNGLSSEQVTAQIYASGNLISDLMILIRLWNIYIYYLTIPAFKHEFNRILCHCQFNFVTIVTYPSINNM